MRLAWSSVTRTQNITTVSPWTENVSYRRLMKKVGGAVTVLWEENVAYSLDQSYRLVIEAYDDRLLGYVDDVLLFSIQDPGLEAGRVGLYCWANTGAHFEALEVEALESSPAAVAASIRRPERA